MASPPAHPSRSSSVARGVVWYVVVVARCAPASGDGGAALDARWLLARRGSSGWEACGGVEGLALGPRLYEPRPRRPMPGRGLCPNLMLSNVSPTRMAAGGGAAPAHVARLRSGHDRRAWTALDHAIRSAGQARRGSGRWLGRGNGRGGPAMRFAVAGLVFVEGRRRLVWLGKFDGCCVVGGRGLDHGRISWRRAVGAAPVHFSMRKDTAFSHGEPCHAMPRLSVGRCYCLPLPLGVGCGLRRFMRSWKLETRSAPTSTACWR